MMIMLKLLPRVQFTDHYSDHDFISFQVQEHPKFPFNPLFLWFQAKFKFNSKSSKSLSQFHHSVNHLMSHLFHFIVYFVTNCLY